MLLEQANSVYVLLYRPIQHMYVCRSMAVYIRQVRLIIQIEIAQSAFLEFLISNKQIKITAEKDFLALM